MSSEKRTVDAEGAVALINQRRDPEERGWSMRCGTRLLDGVSTLLIIASAVILPFILIIFCIILYFISIKQFVGAGDIALITIAAVSAVFAFLSVRESVKDREASVAPKLFLGVRDGQEFGLKNVGEGVAHHLEVRVCERTNDRDDEKQDTGDDDERDGEDNETYEREFENAVLPVGEFLDLEDVISSDDIENGNRYEVTMKYRGNLGTERGPITLIVDGEDVTKELDDG